MLKFLTTTFFLSITLGFVATSSAAPAKPPIILGNSTTPVETPSALPPTCTPPKMNPELSSKFVREVRRQWRNLDLKQPVKESRVCIYNVCGICSGGKHTFSCWIAGSDWSCDAGCDLWGCWGGCH